MSSVCVTTPTLTSTALIPTSSIITTFSDVITTLPFSLSTQLSTTCPPVIEGLCHTTILTSIVTIPGTVLTNHVPVTITQSGVATVVTTLFGTSCSVVAVPPLVVTPPPSSPDTPPVSPPTPSPTPSPLPPAPSPSPPPTQPSPSPSPSPLPPVSSPVPSPSPLPPSPNPSSDLPTQVSSPPSPVPSLPTPSSNPPSSISDSFTQSPNTPNPSPASPNPTTPTSNANSPPALLPTITTPYVTTIVESSTTRRSTVYPTGTAISAQSTEPGHSSSRKAPLAAIIGGVVGGLAFAAVVGFLLYHFFFKSGGKSGGKKRADENQQNYGNVDPGENQQDMSQPYDPSSLYDPAPTQGTQGVLYGPGDQSTQAVSQTYGPSSLYDPAPAQHVQAGQFGQDQSTQAVAQAYNPSSLYDPSPAQHMQAGQFGPGDQLTQSQGQVTYSNVAPGADGTQYAGTGTEQQQSQNPFHSSQDASQNYQGHHQHMLPSSLEQRLQEKIDQYTTRQAAYGPAQGTNELSGAAGANPFTGGHATVGGAAGATSAAAAAGVVAGYHKASQYAVPPSPSPPPGAANASIPSTHSTQYSQSSYVPSASFSPPGLGGQRLPQRRDSSSTGPGGVAEYPDPQMAAYQLQLANQYKGYAEPSRSVKH